MTAEPSEPTEKQAEWILKLNHAARHDQLCGWSATVRDIRDLTGETASRAKRRLKEWHERGLTWGEGIAELAGQVNEAEDAESTIEKDGFDDFEWDAKNGRATHRETGNKFVFNQETLCWEKEAP